MPLSHFLDDGQEPRRPGESNGASRFAESGEHGPARPTGPRDPHFDLLRRVQYSLAARLQEHKIDLTSYPQAQAQRLIEEHVLAIIDEETQRQGLALSRNARASLIERATAEITGLGPIDPLLADDSVTEIMINGPQDVYVMQRGKMVRTTIAFQDEAHIMRVIERIVSRVGRRVDETSPMVDARLPDGSRVNAVIRPVAIDGPKVTIRKFARSALMPEDLVRNGSVTPEVLQFLQACVRGRMNIIVSGGTNSGKSTLLNVLSAFIDPAERIITIEDSAELQLQQEHVVRMESRPASVEGKNRITIRDLLANALRMTPTRIIIGECRGGEALDMLQAMNTGHEGSMTTLHANNTREAISRLEVLTLMSSVDLPHRAIRQQIASAIHLIVHTHLYEDGFRRVAAISEVVPGSGEGVEVREIFEYEPTGPMQGGRLQGRLRPTGVRPHVLSLLDRQRIQLPLSLFQR